VDWVTLATVGVAVVAAAVHDSTLPIVDCACSACGPTFQRSLEGETGVAVSGLPKAVTMAVKVAKEEVVVVVVAAAAGASSVLVVVVADAVGADVAGAGAAGAAGAAVLVVQQAVSAVLPSLCRGLQVHGCGRQLPQRRWRLAVSR